MGGQPMAQVAEFYQLFDSFCASASAALIVSIDPRRAESIAGLRTLEPVRQPVKVSRHNKNARPRMPQFVAKRDRQPKIESTRRRKGEKGL
jgi:hypothetical protein